jgi:excisionase family DNA binding protein
MEVTQRVSGASPDRGTAKIRPKSAIAVSGVLAPGKGLRTSGTECGAKTGVADETYLTVAEISTLLKVNQQTVRNWIDRGELHAVRVGARRVRVLQTDLERFLHSSTATAVRNEMASDGVSLDHIDRRLSERLADVRNATGRGDAGEVADSLAALADVAALLAASLCEPSKWLDDHEARP